MYQKGNRNLYLKLSILIPNELFFLVNIKYSKNAVCRLSGESGSYSNVLFFVSIYSGRNIKGETRDIFKFCNCRIFFCNTRHLFLFIFFDKKFLLRFYLLSTKKNGVLNVRDTLYGLKNALIFVTTIVIMIQLKQR